MVAFIADCISGGDDGYEASMFVKQPGQSLEMFIAANNEPLPDEKTLNGDPGTGRPGLSNSNTMAFVGEFDEAGIGIYTKTLGGSAQLCVQGGDPVPGTVSGIFQGFAGPSINHSNLVAIEADEISDDATVESGVFTCKNGDVQPIALYGDPKTGSDGDFFGDLSDVSLSDNGWVVFVDDDASPYGVWVGGTPTVTVTSTNSSISNVTIYDTLAGVPSGFTSQTIVGFTATGVTDTAAITITFASLPANPVILKVVGGTWKMIYPVNATTGISNVALNGNALSFNIKDGSDCDADGLVNGTVQDPVAAGSSGSAAGSGAGSGCYITTVANELTIDPHSYALIILIGFGLVGLVGFRKKFKK